LRERENRNIVGDELKTTFYSAPTYFSLWKHILYSSVTFWTQRQTAQRTSDSTSAAADTHPLPRNFNSVYTPFNRERSSKIEDEDRKTYENMLFYDNSCEHAANIKCRSPNYQRISVWRCVMVILKFGFIYVFNT